MKNYDTTNCFKTTPRSKDNILPSSFKGYPDVTDIYQFVISSNFLKGQDSNISEEHIEQIMTRLIYDGLIKRFTPRYPCPRTGFKSRIVNDFDDEDDQDTYYVYKAVKNPFSVSGIASIPCGTCPVFSRCSDTGPITPAKCLYFSKWLSF